MGNEDCVSGKTRVSRVERLPLISEISYRLYGLSTLITP